MPRQCFLETIRAKALDKVGKKAAKSSALRLRANDVWKSNNFSHSNIPPVKYRLSNFLSTFRGKKISRLKFHLIGVTNTLTCKSGQRSILTDRSSMAELAGIHSTCLSINKAIRLPDQRERFPSGNMHYP